MMYVSRFSRYGFYTNDFGTLFLYSQNNHRLWYRINAKMVLWAGVLKDVKSKFWRPACCPPPLTLLLSVLGDQRRFANKTAFRALMCPMLTRTNRFYVFAGAAPDPFHRLLRIGRCGQSQAAALWLCS